MGSSFAYVNPDMAKELAQGTKGVEKTGRVRVRGEMGEVEGGLKVKGFVCE